MRLLVVTAVMLLASSAHADENPRRLEWRSEWRPFQTWEHVAGGAATAALFASYLIAPTKPTRFGPVLFDAPVRDALLPESEAGKLRATWVSNITFWGLAAYPFFGDAVVSATLVRKSPDVAAQMVFISAEAMAVNGLLFKILELSVRRGRPYVSDCVRAGGAVDDCNQAGGTTTSMPSGHVSTAVTGAALICTHHLRLHLFDNAATDGAACGLGIAAAMASAVSRIASDNHYTTDVLAGAAIGVVAGWIVPTTLHYGWGSSSRTTARLPLVPFATHNALGVAFVGVN